MVVLAAALVGPATAAAHLRSGTIAVDYGARVSSPLRSAAFSVGIYQSDRAVHLSARPGHVVVVLGYLGGPFVRIDAAGVRVDAGSPTAEATGLVPRGVRRSGWQLQRGRHSVVWHDGRVQQLPPRLRRARWRIPVVVDGRRTAIVGEVWRVSPPAVWPWALTALLVAGLAGALSVRGGPELLRAVSTSFGLAAVVCALVAAVGFTLSAYASPGTWIATVDEACFALAGAGVLVWGPRAARAAAGAGLGVLALAVGLSRGAVFLHSIVLSALPGTLTRLLIVLAIGAGAAAAVAGIVHYVRSEAASTSSS